MRCLLILLSLQLLSTSAIAQKQGQEYIDSLLAILPHLKDDTVKANALGDVAFNYRLIDFKKSLKYGNQCLKLSKELKWERGIGKGHNALGNAYKANSDYDKALQEFYLALAVYERQNNTAAQAVILMNIGTVYRPMKEYSKALNYYDKAYKIALKTDDKKTQALALGNKGVIFFEQDKFEKQIEVNLKALKLFREVEDQNNEAWILSNLGDAYASQKDFQKGIEAHKEAIEVYDELNNLSFKATSLLALGTIYQQMADKEKNPSLRKEYILESVSYLKQAVQLLLELDDKDYLKDAYKSLSDSQLLLGDEAAALVNYKKYEKLKDEVLSASTKESIAGLETKREIEVREREIEIESLKKRTEYIYFSGGLLILLIVIGFIVSNNRRQRRLNVLLNDEKQKSEDLLHNILPEEVAEELKLKGEADARLFDEVTVLFTDFKGFTTIAEQLSPRELVAEIDECFRVFDGIMEKYNVEKIKTIGDAYMAAGGLPVLQADHAWNVVQAAIEIRDYMDRLMVEKQKSGKTAFQIRIGVHTGPVVAGIVGVKKFAYDIWGDTVNTAARMESSGEPGQVNISSTTYEKVKDAFSCTHRGKIEAKNKGEIDMYFVEAKVLN